MKVEGILPESPHASAAPAAATRRLDEDDAGMEGLECGVTFLVNDDDHSQHGQDHHDQALVGPRDQQAAVDAVGAFFSNASGVTSAAAQPTKAFSSPPTPLGPPTSVPFYHNSDLQTGTACDVMAPCGVDLSLCVTSPLEKRWYADRPFPTFTVSLVDKATREVVLLSGLHLRVSLLDGLGVDISDRLSEAVRGHSYPMIDGVASINAVRFHGVSSKVSGNAFRLKVQLSRTSGVDVEPVVSEKLQVLSYRLYHSPKVSKDLLRPEDSVSKMKGIGSQYAKRLSCLGVRRIDELASIDTDALGQDMLHTLRRDRGALTHSRLVEYIDQAVAICARFPDADTTTQTHTVARTLTGRTAKRQRRRLSVQEVSDFMDPQGPRRGSRGMHACPPDHVRRLAQAV